MALYASFLVFTGLVYRKTVTKHHIFREEFTEENLYQDLLQQPSSEMVVLRYCSHMEIHRALQEPQNATIDILSLVSAMDASDHTPYYPYEIQEVALMDDRYVLMLVFDVHFFAYYQYINILVLCAGAWLSSYIVA
jgi:hypothetical protein